MTFRGMVLAGVALTLAGCFDDKKDADGAAAGKPAGDTAVLAENNAPAPATERRTEVGAPFGSAGPRKCLDKKEPKDGAPSKAQIATYVACFVEGQVSDRLYLVDKVEIREIGASRRYQPVVDINMPDIDSRRPVYPIQGSFIRYQCSYLAGMGGSAVKGANCWAYDQPEATGSCYVDSFANWTCSLVDTRSGSQPRKDVAPPA